VFPSNEGNGIGERQAFEYAFAAVLRDSNPRPLGVAGSRFASKENRHALDSFLQRK
jgi:hypothetical protein